MMFVEVLRLLPTGDERIACKRWEFNTEGDSGGPGRGIPLVADHPFDGKLATGLSIGQSIRTQDRQRIAGRNAP